MLGLVLKYLYLIAGMADNMDLFDLCECGELIIGFITAHRFENHEAKYVVYVCPQCLCEFLRESELSIHLRVVESCCHLDAAFFERPLHTPFTQLVKCEQCSFQCVALNKLTEHVRASH